MPYDCDYKVHLCPLVHHFHPPTTVNQSASRKERRPFHGCPFQLFQSFSGDCQQLCCLGIIRPSCLLTNNATDNVQYLAYQLASIAYFVFFHPLSHVPGPWYLAASRIPYIRHNLNGTLLPWMQELHEKYGPMVRYTPNEVSAQNRHF